MWSKNATVLSRRHLVNDAHETVYDDHSRCGEDHDDAEDRDEGHANPHSVAVFVKRLKTEKLEYTSQIRIVRITQ